MLKRAVRIYLVPAKPVRKPPYLLKRDPAFGLTHLKNHAEALCRDIFAKLALLDPSRIRKVSSPKVGVR